MNKPVRKRKKIRAQFKLVTPEPGVTLDIKRQVVRSAFCKILRPEIFEINDQIDQWLAEDEKYFFDLMPEEEKAQLLADKKAEIEQLTREMQMLESGRVLLREEAK